MSRAKLYDILSTYARSQGIELNKDREFVLTILTGLLKNEERYGYRACPCRLAKGVKEKDADIVCPCIYRDPDIREWGSCYCGLYVSKEWNSEEVPHVLVPERRPVETQFP
jgi:ferredoxin-thioredoxin reductase catalytic subunit